MSDDLVSKSMILLYLFKLLTYLLKTLTGGSEESKSGLQEFTESLSKFTRFSTFRTLATLSYASDIYSGSSIVSRYMYFHY